MTTHTHKATGWTRTAQGYGNWLITPTDNSGVREVAFMSAHSWANLPNDDKANIDRDRVVLVSGAQLPQWAQTWLETVNHKSMVRAREAFQAALDDADFAADRRDADSY